MLFHHLLRDKDALKLSDYHPDELDEVAMIVKNISCFLRTMVKMEGTSVVALEN